MAKCSDVGARPKPFACAICNASLFVFLDGWYPGAAPSLFCALTAPKSTFVILCAPFADARSACCCLLRFPPQKIPGPPWVACFGVCLSVYFFRPRPVSGQYGQIFCTPASSLKAAGSTAWFGGALIPAWRFLDCKLLGGNLLFLSSASLSAFHYLFWGVPDAASKPPSF